MLLSVIIFIIILGVLIFVHELGHFLIAKKSGIRVDEFALGFPPRLFSFHRKGTDYSLNWIPFGGYVKIFGENPDEESMDKNAQDSFIHKSKGIQASVLFGGVLFNIIFAWILMSVSFMSGFPAVVTEENIDQLSDFNVVVTSVAKDSPAHRVGLEMGDALQTLLVGDQVIEPQSIDEVQSFIAQHADNNITITYLRSEEQKQVVLEPIHGILEGKQAIGISMSMIGRMQLGFFPAIAEGFVTTGQMLKEVVVGLWTLITQSIEGETKLSENVAGPIGIVGLVDDATNFGFVYLLGFTAFISLNLAVLNLVPFPALDGGRLFFLLIEVIVRRPLNPKILNIINGFGFLVLMILMLLITFNDILNLL